MLVKGYSIVVELQAVPKFQRDIREVLDTDMDDEGRFVIGTSLEHMAGSGGADFVGNDAEAQGMA